MASGKKNAKGNKTAHVLNLLTAPGGGGAPQGEEETTYHSQAGSARRLLERIVELDERLNRRLAGKNSFYEQKK